MVVSDFYSLCGLDLRGRDGNLFPGEELLLFRRFRFWRSQLFENPPETASKQSDSMAIRNFSSTPKSNSADWTRPFRPTSAQRSGQLTIWTMTACALLLPVAFTRNTEAESATSPIATTSQNASLNSLSTPLPPAPGVVVPGVVPVVVPDKSPLNVAAPKTATLTAIVSGQTQSGNVTLQDGLTVGEALAQMGIALSPTDRVAPDASATFRSGLTVRVTRVAIETRTRREPIAAEVRYQPTTAIKAGTSQVTQYPQAGYKEIVEKVWKKDGKETMCKEISRSIGRAPQPKIIALGVTSRFMPAAIAPHKRYARALSYRGGGPRDRMLAARAEGKTPLLKVARKLTMLTTGYNGAEAGGGGARTATGLRVGYGAVAVDPRVIPLGSKLYIEGYGYGFACDTGGAIKGNHIDLAFNSVRQANDHGKQRGVAVYVLSP